jgi:hypothetical protein
VPQWVIDEAAGRAVTPPVWRASERLVWAEPAPPRRTRWAARVPTGLVVAGLLGVAALGHV